MIIEITVADIYWKRILLGWNVRFFSVQRFHFCSVVCCRYVLNKTYLKLNVTLQALTTRQNTRVANLFILIAYL